MTTPQAPVRERPGGYRRSSSGLIGAMVATVVAVLVFVGFRSLTRDNDATPVPSVDWQISFKAARADGKLAVLAPASLPSGWKATSVSFTPGAEPAWHLGLLTSTKRYVGIEESRDELRDLVHLHVDPDASKGADVTLDGTAWQVFTDSGGDYALGRTVDHAGETESQLVVGSAPASTIRSFAAGLTGR
jgi:hypothetical protein